MSSIINRSSVDIKVEERILKTLIVSTEFCSKLLPVAKTEYFQSEVISKSVKWISKFYSKYKKSPGVDFISIAEENAKKLSVSDREILNDLIDKFEDDRIFTTNKINWEYMLDSSINYFQERSLCLLSDDLKENIERGNLPEAKELLSKYSVDRIKINESSGHIINPFETGNIISVWDDDEVRKNQLLRFPGILGDVIGPLEREWLLAFMAPMKRGKCLSRSNDNKVLMANGDYIGIIDLLESKRSNSISYNEGTDIFEKDNIVEYWENGVKPVYKVITKSGRSIEVTNNHPLLTPSGWKELQYLKKGDFIANPKNLSIFGKEHLPEHEIRLLAYFIADGDTHEDIDLGSKLPRYTKGEKAIQKDFIRCVELMKCQVRPVGDGISFLVVNGKHNFRKHGKNYVKNLLKNHDVWNKYSYQKNIPSKVFRLCKKDLALFLNILFTGDGSVYKGTIEYCSTSKQLAEGVHHLLTRFGIVSSIRYKENNCRGAYLVEIRSYENIKRFIDEINFSFSKKEKAVKILSTIQPTLRSFLDRVPHEVAIRWRNGIQNYCIENELPLYKTLGKKQWTSINYKINKGGPLMRQLFNSLKGDLPIVKKLLDSNIMWDEIISIKYVGKKETVDLTMKSNHNFIVQNMLVHNSNMLIETTFQGIISGLKVAFFSFEMNNRTFSKRLQKRFLPYTSSKDKTIYYPVFDCILNQSNECDMDERVSKIGLDKKAKGKYIRGYVPCTVCRGGRDYRTAVWWERITKEKIKVKRVTDYFNNFKKLMGDNIRSVSYPMNSAGIADIEYDLDYMFSEEGFIPDVLVIDYADIMLPDNRKLEGRDKYDEIWKNMKRLASERKCLVVTASQGNRRSLDAANIKASDIPEDVRKLGHVDALVGINQTPEDKALSYVRMVVLNHRHIEFDSQKQVCVLQHLDDGQFNLDNEYM